MKREGYVYFLTTVRKNVLYIGVASNLQKRIREHRNHIYKGCFTDKKRYSGKSGKCRKIFTMK